MTQTLAKYHARFPRYILQAQDNTLVRVAGPKQEPWEEATEIQNISLSGLAFTAPAELCPLVGEWIKIQFSVPGSETMACHGLVTRLEVLSSSTILVAVQFKHLELPQRLALAQALALKIREQLNREKVSHKVSMTGQFLQLCKTKKTQTFAAGFFLLVWCVLFYVLSTILSST